MLIPLSETAKKQGDVAAIGTAAAAYFNAIPWTSLAASAAFVYTALRIAELLYGWFKKRDP